MAAATWPFQFQFQFMAYKIGFCIRTSYGSRPVSQEHMGIMWHNCTSSTHALRWCYAGFATCSAYMGTQVEPRVAHKGPSRSPVGMCARVYVLAHARAMCGRGPQGAEYEPNGPVCVCVRACARTYDVGERPRGGGVGAQWACVRMCTC